MTCRIPKRLKKEPLIEAIWQVQLEPAPEQALGDVLPGVLFSALRSRQPGLQIRRLPVADIPAPVAALDPNLRFAAKYRIEAPPWPYLFHIGNRVITINCRRPYLGWDDFKVKILELIDVLESSGFVPAPNRHSLRYIDLLQLDTLPGLAGLRVGLTVGDHQIIQDPLQMRVEVADGDCIHVLQVATGAQVRLNDMELQGTLIDQETLAVLPEPSWDRTREGLEALHEASKRLFFCQILSESAVALMEPDYEETQS